MNRAALPEKRLRTASTTSTTGPHVRLVQNSGVANTSTNGTCARSESATEQRRSALSGGLRVVSARKLPCVLAIVGVRDAIARSPPSGAWLFRVTITFPTAWTGEPPTGWTTTQ